MSKEPILLLSLSLVLVVLLPGAAFPHGGRTDATGNSNTGTLNEAIWVGQGKYGAALSFDGVNDLLVVNDAPSLHLSSAMTLEAWVYPTVVPSYWKAIVQKQVDAYLLTAGSSGGPPAVGGTLNGVCCTNVSAPTALAANSWTHVAGTYDGTVIRLYPNGVQVASTPATGGLETNANPLRIGGNTYGGEYFQGRIDEVRIYNRALSGSELQTDMNTPVGGTLPPDTTAPTVPANFMASAGSSSQINLSWMASTDNVRVSGYRVERCQGAGCATFTQIATPTGITYSNTGLTANTNYRYRVRAVDGAGNLSGYSSIASAATQSQSRDTTAPTVPANLGASAGSSSQINLSWMASTDNVRVSGYRVERCQGAGCATFTQIATPTGITYSNTGLTANTNYRYRVRAVDGAGNLSGYSSIASATTQSPSRDTTAPTVPANLRASAGSSSQINLSWTASTDNVRVTGYRVESCQGTSCTNFTQIGTPAGTTFNTSGLTAGTAYLYRVRAADAAGNLSEYSVNASATTQKPASGPSWPLRLSANGKYLETQAGVPYLTVADAGWELTTQLSDQDAIVYLNDRVAKGFNAVEIRVIGHSFQSNAPNNFYHEAPFTNGPNNWSVRNEAYWTRIDYILTEMRNRGMVVFLFPAYLGYGCGNEGWCQEMLVQTDAVMTNYGQWIGNRYKDYGNVIWMTGGDFVATDAVLSRNNAIVNGIRSVDSDVLFSVETSRGQVGGIDSYTSQVDINAVYAGDPQDLVQRAYNSARPFMYQEGWYENEHGTPLVDVEAQAMITFLGGGLIGHTFGSCPLWTFGPGPGWCDSLSAPFNNWQNNLNSPGSIAVGATGKLMRSRKWWTLVPDYANSVVTSSKGSGLSYRAAAREAGGETVMAWTPTTSQITVDMTKVSGSQVTAWWYNPDNNSSVLIGTYPATGTRSFTPASARKVLVLDNASLNLPAPGTTIYGGTPPLTASTALSQPTNFSATAQSTSPVVF